MNEKRAKEQAEQIFDAIKKLYNDVIERYASSLRLITSAVSLKSKRFSMQIGNIFMVIQDDRHICLELKREHEEFLTGTRKKKSDYEKYLQRAIPFGYYFSHYNERISVQDMSAVQEVYDNPFYCQRYKDNKIEWRNSLGKEADKDAVFNNLALVELVLRNFEEWEGHIYDILKAISMLIGNHGLYINAILERPDSLREFAIMKREFAALAAKGSELEAALIQKDFKVAVILAFLDYLAREDILRVKKEPQKIAIEDFYVSFAKWTCPSLEVIRQKKDLKYESLYQDVYICKPFPVTLPNGRSYYVHPVKTKDCFIVDCIQEKK